ncbi:MAG: metalloregulator ArsR/SmtB family transcription factor [Pseudomonadota bacterium]
MSSQVKTLGFFSALSQPTRLDVTRLLVQAGQEGILAGEIAARLKVRQNTMSANLAVLRRAGVVTTRREGRAIRYFANFAGIRQALSYFLEDCCGGDRGACDPLLAKIGLAREGTLHG